MKALVVTAAHTVEQREISAPEPGPHEALVRVLACGICSTTDRELVRGTQPYHKDYPCVLGHEAVGEVVAVGARVRAFRPGDWVTRPVAIWPGTRRDGLASAWGGFAEYGIVRDRCALAADGDASLLEDYTALRQQVVPRDGLDAGAAVLAISLAETASWFRHLPPVAGQAVCVGGTGIAGLSIALWAKLAGAATVVVLGRRAERLALARAVGADHALDTRDPATPAAVRELTGGGAAVHCEAVGGRDQARLGLSVLRDGGTLAIYGVTEDLAYDLAWKDLPGAVRIVRPPAEEHRAYAWAADLIRRGHVPVDRLLSHRWPLARHAEAFAAVGRGEVVKGLLEMDA